MVGASVLDACASLIRRGLPSRFLLSMARTNTEGHSEMLGYKVFSAGLPGLLTQAVCQDVQTSVSAAGTTQGTATELTAADSEVTSVASGAGVVLSSLATAGDEQTVFNGGANPLKVYPPSGQQINSLTANLHMTLAVNTGVMFKKVSSSRWFGVLSA